MLDKILDRLFGLMEHNVDVVKSAPLAFAALVILAFVGGALAARIYYSNLYQERLAVQEATIKALSFRQGNLEPVARPQTDPSSAAEFKLDVIGAGFADNQAGSTIVQLTVSIENHGNPSPAHGWKLEMVRPDGLRIEGVGLTARAPLAGTLALGSLQEKIGNSPLAGEATGYLWFLLKSVAYRELMGDVTSKIAKLVLSVKDSSGRVWKTERTVESLAGELIQRNVGPFTLQTIVRTVDIMSLMENEKSGDLYRTEFTLTVHAKSPFPDLNMQVNAATIVRMSISGERSGVSSTRQSEAGSMFVSMDIPNAHGSYKVTIFSKKQESKFVVYVKPVSQSSTVGPS